MHTLDDIKSQKVLDKEQTYESIIAYPMQCQHAFDATSNLVIPSPYADINKILMTGMGGSGLGARIIESLYGLQLSVPILHLHDYDLPSWVDSNTLCVFSSFSGTTEETVQNAKQAIEKGFKWMAIGTGGDLISLAKEQSVPYYQIDPTYNPSKQPRLAIGYSIIGQLNLVSKIGIFDFSKSMLKDIIDTLNTIIATSNRDIPFEKNPAKQLAEKLFNRQAVFVASRHLVGASHVIKNQMNENAKRMATIFEIPELNHHLMEGLTYPKSNQETLGYIMVQSNLYPERIQKRFLITKDIIAENHVMALSIDLHGATAIDQAFELIQLGGFVNYYLAMLNGIDPAPIPYVDEFKIRLGQSLGQWK